MKTKSTSEEFRREAVAQVESGVEKTQAIRSAAVKHGVDEAQVEKWLKHPASYIHNWKKQLSPAEKKTPSAAKAPAKAKSGTLDAEQRAKVLRCIDAGEDAVAAMKAACKEAGILMPSNWEKYPASYVGGWRKQLGIAAPKKKAKSVSSSGPSALEVAATPGARWVEAHNLSLVEAGDKVQVFAGGWRLVSVAARRGETLSVVSDHPDVPATVKVSEIRKRYVAL